MEPLNPTSHPEVDPGHRHPVSHERNSASGVVVNKTGDAFVWVRRQADPRQLTERRPSNVFALRVTWVTVFWVVTGSRSPRRSPPWRADNVVEPPGLDDPPDSGPDPDNQCTPPPRAAVGVDSPLRGVLVVLRSRPSRLRLATRPILWCNVVQAPPSKRPEPQKCWSDGGARWNRTTDLSIISAAL